MTDTSDTLPVITVEQIASEFLLRFHVPFVVTSKPLTIFAHHSYGDAELQAMDIPVGLTSIHGATKIGTDPSEYFVYYSVIGRVDAIVDQVVAIIKAEQGWDECVVRDSRFSRKFYDLPTTPAANEPHPSYPAVDLFGSEYRVALSEDVPPRLDRIDTSSGRFHDLIRPLAGDPYRDRLIPEMSQDLHLELYPGAEGTIPDPMEYLWDKYPLAAAKDDAQAAKDPDSHIPPFGGDVWKDPNRNVDTTPPKPREY